MDKRKDELERKRSTYAIQWKDGRRYDYDKWGGSRNELEGIYEE